MSPPPIATITNNLGYDVDIYDVYNPNPSTPSSSTPSNGTPSTPSPPPALLTYTHLATVPSGATSQQVQTNRACGSLQAMRTGNITTLADNYYQQFPVAVMATVPANLPVANANVFTLTSDMQKGMDESFKFIKYAQANPSSQLAKDFGTALGDPTNQKNAINAFFQGSGSFPQCSFSTWTAVLEWQAQFTNAWQGTYYLYSLGSGSSGSTGSTTGTTDSTDTTDSSAPALVAKLVIKSTANENSAVLTMANSGGQSTPVVMAPGGTMQEQNAGTGPLSVSLTPVWMNITQTSQQNGKTVSTYVIGAAFSGTINGIHVTGNLNKLAIPSPSETSTNPNKASGKNSANKFSLNSLEGLVGMLTSIGMLYYMAKDSKAAETQNKNDARASATGEADAKAKVSQIEQSYQKNEVSVVNNYYSTNLEVKVVPNVEDAYKQIDQAEEVQAAQRAVDEQSKELVDVLQDDPGNSDVSEAGDELSEAENNLEDAENNDTNATDIKKDVDEATNDVENASDTLTSTVQQEGTEASQQEVKDENEAAEALKDEQKEGDAIKKAEEKQEKENEENPDEQVDGEDEGNAERTGKDGDVKDDKSKGSEGKSGEGTVPDLVDGKGR